MTHARTSSRRVDGEALRGRNLASRLADRGFTLIELLVVITILGILSAIVVFAVNGIGDKGGAAAAKTDAQILLTAEETYFAKNGRYASLSELRSSGFLASNPQYNGVVVPSDGSVFVVGSTAFGVGSGGIRVLTATDGLTPMGFLAQSFIDGNGPINFTPGGQGGAMAAAANELAVGTSNPAIPTWAPTDTVLITADELNLNKTILVGGPDNGAGDGTTGKSFGFFPGVCTKQAVGTPSGQVQSSPQGTTGVRQCTGVAMTKRQYAAGRLAVFTCSAAEPLPPATKCNQPPGGYVTPVSSIQQVVAKFPANGKLTPSGSTNFCPQPVLAVPYSGASNPTTVVGTAPSAPYGFAAWQALTNQVAIPSTGGGSGFVTFTEFSNLVGNKCIALGRTLTDTEKIIREGGPTITIGNADNGTQTAQYALLPTGTVQNPTGVEGTPAPVPPSLHSPIRLFVIVLQHSATTTGDYNRGRDFVNYLLSPKGQAVLRGYGYDAPPSQSNV